MQYSLLGSSGIQVSRVCLGTMTWGMQNSQRDADRQIEYALAQGVNFFDTAELYPVPPKAETYGDTEAIVGNWLARNRNKRGDIVLASKIAGVGLAYIRNGKPISGAAVIEAIDASLKRLQTDYIDLFQLHWPNRISPHFGKHWPNRYRFSDFNGEEEISAMLDILQALDQSIKAGKIRHCGLSDDTPWGVSTYLKLSEKYGLPRIVSVQNEFSLLHAKDWPYMLEHCVMENVAYLPWSPLAGGILTGKYLNGARPLGSRWTLVQRHGLFRDTERVAKATQAYVNIAKQYDVTPAQLALKWCDQIDGVTSTIIGATTIDQLKENLAAFDGTVHPDINAEINRVQKLYPLPF